MPRKVIGLEVGSNNLKIVSGYKKKGQFILEASKIIKNSDKIFGLDGELNINEIYPIFISALEELNVKTGDCYITISSPKTIIRTRDLPIVRKKEMDNIIKFEADQFLPYSSEAFSIDYKVVGSFTDEEGGNYAKVMIVAVPKELVDDYMALINLTKLTLKGLTVYTDSVYSYFSQFTENEDKNVLIVDVGFNNTQMLMLENNHYFANISNDKAYNEVYRRIIESGKIRGEQVTDLLNGKFDGLKDSSIPSQQIENEPKSVQSPALENKLAGLSSRMNAIKNNKPSNEEKVNDLRDRLSKMKNKNTPTEGIELKKEETSNSPDVDKIMARIMNNHGPTETVSKVQKIDYNQVLENAYYEISREVLRMVDFFKTRKYDTYVDEIHLIGGGSNMHNFAKYIEEATDIKTKVQKNTEIADGQVDANYVSLVPAIGAIIGG